MHDRVIPLISNNSYEFLILNLSQYRFSMAGYKVLKASSAITTIILGLYIVFIVLKWDMYADVRMVWFLVVTLSVLAILISHSLTVLYLLQSFYPKREIPKALRIFFRWQSIGCWLSIGFLILGTIGMIVGLSETRSGPTMRGLVSIILIIILIIFLLIQLVLSRRLIRTIQANHNDIFVDSFL